MGRVLAKKPEKHWAPLSLSPVTRCICPTYHVPPEGSRTQVPPRDRTAFADCLLPEPLFSAPCFPAPSKFVSTESFSSRSFEGNLNIYKQLAIKKPDSQITKVGDGCLPAPRGVPDGSR